MKSPSFGKSYRSRNILTRVVQKSLKFGKSESNKNIEPLAPAERLLTASSPYMVFLKGVEKSIKVINNTLRFQNCMKI